MSVVSGLASAVCWFIASILTFWTGGSYWDGPPPHIRWVERGSIFLNAMGALFAAVAIGYQSVNS